MAPDHLTGGASGQVRVTHSLDTATLPNPDPIEGQHPDLVARGGEEKLIIGLAKLAPEIADEQSLEQYRFFANYREPGADESAALNIAVPGSCASEARAALAQAGLATGQFNLVPVNGFSG